GYAGGTTPNPTYEEVCSGLTGHAEVVLVVYDPKATGYEALLKLFWESHDPTQGMRQGNDIGTQYRSAIYTYSAEQKAAAEASRQRYQARLAAAGYGPITTEIRDAPPFYFAEDYHQQYLAKNPFGYCGLGGTGVACPAGLEPAAESRPAPMQFGVQFFPDVRPEERDAATYFADALDLAEEADRLGYGHIRIVEHYFHYYGGYSPNPIVFLAAAARRARLVTGAVLPAFNHPLKLAGEIAMLDAISGGRLDVGFARAFLPHEFRRFGRSPDESVARFREGIEQVDLLLREENVSHRGRFHTIENTTSLPRPTQKPRPKFYVAALNTPESFEYAGRMGYAVMAIAFVADKMRPLLAAYREAWQAAGHPGRGEAMIAFHMFCDADGARARAIAAPLI